MKNHFNLLFFLTVFLIIKSLWALFEIATGYIGLAPDEAQYWTWSQNLDWAFYSKPPGIAWQIWLGCKVFGDTELGVRFGSVVISFFTTYAIYALAFVSSLTPLTCFWAALVFLFSPIGLMGNFASTTDGGMILFWTLAAIPFAYALQKQKKANFCLMGLLILCGALFKWPIYILWVFFIFFSVIFPAVFSINLFTGVIISLFGLLPSFIWNMTHEWATFRHVITQSTGGHHKKFGLFHGNFWDFFGAQFGVLSPIFFILLLISLIYVAFRPSKTPKPIKFCSWTCLIILGFFLIFSLFTKMQANWALYAYPTGLISLCWFSINILKKGYYWLIAGTVLSIITVSAILLIPLIQENNILPNYKIPYKINPFRHDLGWKNLSKDLTKAGYNPNKDYLFSDTYQMTSILSFYSPMQKRAYFLNIDSKRKNQFSFWPQLKDEQLNKPGYYVWSQNSEDFEKGVEGRIVQHIDKLKPYFKEVEFVQMSPLFYCYEKVTKGALIYKCIEYNGKAPKESGSY